MKIQYLNLIFDALMILSLMRIALNNDFTIVGISCLSFIRILHER